MRTRHARLPNSTPQRRLLRVRALTALYTLDLTPTRASFILTPVCVCVCVCVCVRARGIYLLVAIRRRTTIPQNVAVNGSVYQRIVHPLPSETTYCVRDRSRLWTTLAHAEERLGNYSMGTETEGISQKKPHNELPSSKPLSTVAKKPHTKVPGSNLLNTVANQGQSKEGLSLDMSAHGRHRHHST